MKEVTLSFQYSVLQYAELSETDKQLVDTAKKASYGAYAPYSQFCVGAAMRYADGTIVCGSNQENAAYPSGLCAERTVLFAAGSRRGVWNIDTLAIAARRGDSFSKRPVTPCGACRQVMAEMVDRLEHPLRLLLYGEDFLYEIANARDLLPLDFNLDIT